MASLQRRKHGRRKPISKFKRPYATRYYGELDADEDAYVTQGTSKTEEGAVRGAVFRVFVRQYSHATITDRDTGAVLYTIRPSKKGLDIHYGRAVGARLRLVK